jgi:AcrR family transcriptional regulator
MSDGAPIPSARRGELLEAAYRQVLTTGLADMSLRPLASAIDSSPRVLLYLFGSKDGLVRALLDRARKDELTVLEQLRGPGAGPAVTMAEVARRVWSWLAAPEHRPLLTLWVEAYGRSLIEPAGAWAGFARTTVEDWLAILAAAQPEEIRDTDAAAAARTAMLSVLRGAFLDLLATGDLRRTTAAVQHGLGRLAAD